MASPRPQSVPFPLMTLLVMAGLLAGGRAVQLAVWDWMAPRKASPDGAADPQHSAAIGAPSTCRPADQVAPQPAPVSPELRTMIAAACPHALELLDSEGLVEPVRLPAVEREPLRVAMRPSAAATPMRIAQRDPVWLVPPDDWYAPEDLSRRNHSGEQADDPSPADERSRAPDALQPDTLELEEPQNELAETARPAIESPAPPASSPSEPSQEPASTLNDAPNQSTPAKKPSISARQNGPREQADQRAGAELLPQPQPSSTPLFPAPSAEPPAAATQPQPQPVAPSPHSPAAAARDAGTQGKLSSIQAHRDLFAQNCYPSARVCGECHKKIYDEWRISSHAYAFVSPMFQKFEQRITDLSQGTVGYFCYRCHSPVATSMGECRTTPLWDMPQVAREGVTCIACHRVNERYTKSNGERRVVPGDIYAPVYGGIGGQGVAEVIARKDHYKVKTSPDQQGAGQAIHLEGRYFDQLGKAEFCTSCHQVAVHPGIKLEVVWEQYRQSPARKKGVTCQDCHMGLKPGEASGYEICSIAEVGGKSVNDHRKHANHIFYGPNYSISHPGVFPDNKDADRWKMNEWLRFNWRAGWGTDAFEDAVDDGRLTVDFPPEWREADDRYDAREVIDDNLKAMGRKQKIREEVMSHSLRITGPFFKHDPSVGRDLRLYYDVTNLNEGHNVLTASLGAQPQLWANIVLVGPGGERLWETGYTDSDGDVCDIHSRDVRTGRAPFDYQLFNLQTMFLITGATGTDREMPLPVNVDIDQLPFLRPGAIPITTTNHPPFIRMESRSIAPLGTKRVHYKVPGKLLGRPGKYRLSFRMRNRIEPIWFMRFCNATDEMVRAMNEGILDIHPRSVEFYVR